MQKTNEVLLFYADNIFMKRPVNNEQHTSSIHAYLTKQNIVCRSLYNIEAETLMKEIEIAQPKYLGIGINFLSKLSQLKEFISKLKEKVNDCMIISYGLFANSDYDYLNKYFYNEFDFIIRGNPVVEFYNIVINNDKRADKTKIILRSNAKVNINKLCAPAKNIKNELNTMASRGCLNNCIFCEEKPMYKGYEYRPVQSVVEEIKQHVYSSDLDFDCWVFFSDLDFLSITEMDKTWIGNLCNELEKMPRKIKFTFQTRADRISLNKENLKMLKKVGLEGISLGIESGSNEVLSKFNKCIQSNIVNYEALQVLQEIKILYKINFIMYEPMTSLENIKENLEFFDKVQFPKGTIPSQPLVSYLSKLIVLHGSSCYNYYIKKYSIDFKLNNYIVEYDFKDERMNLYYSYVLQWRDKIKKIVKEHYRLLNYVLYNMVNQKDSLIIQHIGFQIRKIDLEFMKKLLQVVSHNGDANKTIEEFYSLFENIYDRIKRLGCYNMSNKIQFRGWHGPMNSLND